MGKYIRNQRQLQDDVFTNIHTYIFTHLFVAPGAHARARTHTLSLLAARPFSFTRAAWLSFCGFAAAAVS